MSEVTQGGAQTEDLGAGQENPEIKKETKTKVINPADHERAVKDMLKYKGKIKELESTLEEREQALLAKEKAILEQQNDWKAIADIKEKEALSYKSKWETSEKKNQDFWSTYYQNEKKNAVFKEAIKAGLRKEAESDLDLLGFDDIAIERTDQGRVMVHGASDFVENLKSSRPHWFQSKGAANINSGGTNKPDLNPETLDAKKMAELNLKDPKKFKELWPKYLESIQKRSK